MKYRKVVSLIVSGTMLSAFLLSGASAADSVAENVLDGNDASGEYNYQPMEEPTAEELAAAAAKMADLSRAVELLGLGYADPNTPAVASVNDVVSPEDIAEAHRILEKYGPVEESATTRSSAVSTKKQLYLTAVKQENSYYCGPATAYMILTGQGCSVTQSGLAGSSYLQTDANGQTPFGSNWTKTMNAYSNHSYSLMWGDGSDSTSSAIKLTDAAIATIYSGYGVVCDTIQRKNGSARLAGYPASLTSDIYHYVAADGYDASDASNRECYYVDPNFARPEAYGHRLIGFRLMASLVTERGLVV